MDKSGKDSCPDRARVILILIECQLSDRSLKYTESKTGYGIPDTAIEEHLLTLPGRYSVNVMKYITVLASALAGATPHPALPPAIDTPIAPALNNVTNNSLSVKKCGWQSNNPPGWHCKTDVSLQDVINDMKAKSGEDEQSRRIARHMAERGRIRKRWPFIIR